MHPNQIGDAYADSYEACMEQINDAEECFKYDGYNDGGNIGNIIIWVAIGLFVLYQLIKDKKKQ